MTVATATEQAVLIGSGIAGITEDNLKAWCELNRILNMRVESGLMSAEDSKQFWASSIPAPTLDGSIEEALRRARLAGLYDA